MSNITKLTMLLCIGLFLAAASVWFIGGKKKEYDVKATIKARPYQLFPYLVEPELKKKWVSGLVDEKLVAGAEDIENETEPTYKVGASLHSVMEFEGKNAELIGSVIRYKDNEVVSTKSKNDEMSLTSFFMLKDKGNETEVEYRKIIRFDGMSRFMSVFEDDLNQQVLESEMKKLVELVESETDNSIQDPNVKDSDDAEPDESNGSATKSAEDGSSL